MLRDDLDSLFDEGGWGEMERQAKSVLFDLDDEIRRTHDLLQVQIVIPPNRPQSMSRIHLKQVYRKRRLCLANHLLIDDCWYAYELITSRYRIGLLNIVWLPIIIANELTITSIFWRITMKT